MRRAAILALGLGSVAALAACSAIIGTRDLTLEAGDAGLEDSGVVVDSGTTLTDGTAPGDSTTAVDSSTGPMTGDSGATDSAPSDASCSAADLQTDKNNCGTCGHGCLGGACAAGMCQPFTLVPNQLGAVGLALDTTSIYWTTLTTPQVSRANKDGTDVTVLASDGVDTLPWDIALDETTVYWSDNEGSGGSIHSCPKSGGDGGITLMTPATLSYATGVAVDQGNVYWAEQLNNAVGRVTKMDGGGGTGFGYLVTQLYGGNEVTVDDASVFFTSYDTVGVVGKGNTLVTDPTNDTTDAAAVRVLYTSASATGPYGITTDATNVYWIVQSAGLVEYAPRTGTGATSVLASGEDDPLMIAVDDTNVYWTANGTDTGAKNGNSVFLTGYVATCPKTGCPSTGPTLLTPKNLHNPYAIAVDATAIYFTIDGNVPDGQSRPTEGSVMKIAK